MITGTRRYRHNKIFNPGRAGRRRSDENNRSGKKHREVEVIADSVYFAESKRDNQLESPVEDAIASGDFIPVDMDEDCPF